MPPCCSVRGPSSLCHLTMTLRRRTGLHPVLSSRQARFEQLEKAQEHNLDVADVARRTVEKILADALAVRWTLSLWAECVTDDTQIPVEAQQSSLWQTNQQVSELESELIKSIEWLTFFEETYIDALRQANALARFFLGALVVALPCAVVNRRTASGKSHAARELLLSLPPDLPAFAAAQSTGEDDPLNGLLTEHSDYRLLFSCLQAYAHYSDVWAKRPVKKCASCFRIQEAE